MRGFPLANTLFVLAIFAIAWWPLRVLTDAPSASEKDAIEKPAEVASPFVLRLSVTGNLERLTVEHLGSPILSLQQSDFHQDEEHRFDEIALPAEGVEFWVEATFTSEEGQNHRHALGMEIIPDDFDREAKFVTLWSQPGEGSIADLATFQWPETTD